MRRHFLLSNYGIHLKQCNPVLFVCIKCEHIVKKLACCTDLIFCVPVTQIETAEMDIYKNSEKLFVWRHLFVKRTFFSIFLNHLFIFCTLKYLYIQLPYAHVLYTHTSKIKSIINLPSTVRNTATDPSQVH